MPGIEFVPDDADTASDPGDEELADGPRPRRRGRMALLAGAAAALVAGAAVLHHTGSVSGPQGAAPSGSFVPADPVVGPDVPSGAYRVDHLTGEGDSAATDTPADAPEGAHPGRSPAAAGLGCPSSSYCTRSFDTPVDVIGALTNELSVITDLSVVSVLIQGAQPTVALWQREITASAGPLRVHVELHLASDHDDPRTGRAPRGTGTVVYATALARGLAVVVTVWGPTADVPSRAAVARLAADRRLLAVPA